MVTDYCCHRLPQLLSPLNSSSSSSSFRPSSSLLLSRNRRISSCSASPLMNPQNTSSSSSKLLEFPYVSAPHRDLMVELLSSVETRLASPLRPRTLPPDVQSYQNQSATAQAALHVRSGIQCSQVETCFWKLMVMSLMTSSACRFFQRPWWSVNPRNQQG